MTTTYESTRQGFTSRPNIVMLNNALAFTGWSKARLAKEAGISPSTIGNILGKRGQCSAATAGAINDAFKRALPAQFWNTKDENPFFTPVRIDYAA